MYQLRYLCTNAFALLPRPPSNSPDSRENVQSLSTISPESCTEHVFARVPNIKRLGIRGKLVVLFDDLFDNVGKLQYLTNLKLFNNVYHDTPSVRTTLNLPPAHKFPSKLQKLTLLETSLCWEDMHILGNLEKLEVLKLKDNAFKGELWESRDGGFPSLKLLQIGRTDLSTWIASKHHFPSLARLVLRHYDKLDAVQASLADIASFQELELYRTSKKAAASAREIHKKRIPKEGQDTKTNVGFKLAIYPPNI